MRVKTDNVERVVSDEYGRELVASKKPVEVPGKRGRDQFPGKAESR